MTYKRKLIEVALPLDAINRESAREKSIRHGHPSTLHLWWARRPLAAARAVLWSSLVDDPSAHPDRFPTMDDQEVERQRLFRILEELVKWENSNNPKVLEAAKAEILASCDGELPNVLDPFCGGGTIPLEAQRLGLPAYGGDLNPVAVLISKAMVEIPPRFAGMPPVNPKAQANAGLRTWEGAQGLAEDVRYYGEWMRNRAFEKIGHLYPKVELPAEQGGGEATVIAWIWARTVESPDPSWNGHVPLIRSWVLRKGTRNKSVVWIEPVVDRDTQTITYKIREGGTPLDETRVTTRGDFRCLATGASISNSYVRARAMEKNIGEVMIAVVGDGPTGRVYLQPMSPPTVKRPVERLLPLPPGGRYMAPPLYGFEDIAELFTPRQQLAMTTFSDVVSQVRDQIASDALESGFSPDSTRLTDGGAGSDAYADGLTTYLAFCVDKLANLNSNLCYWEPVAQCPRGVFGRQAIPMRWDFAESNPLGDSSGSWIVIVDGMVRTFASAAWPTTARFNVPVTSVTQGDARARVAQVPSLMMSTDPPYYDNVGYSDLADFFYPWLRRSLVDVWPDVLSTVASPKLEEMVADAHRAGSKAAAIKHFEEGMRETFAVASRHLNPYFPTSVFYAFKQEEIGPQGKASTGWETFLEGLLASGLGVMATWPVRTEMLGALKQGKAVLASSIVIACRPRPMDAPRVSAAEFVAALRGELPDAVRLLQKESIAPVDMAQSAIGPGMAVFSRYSGVVEATDEPMSVRRALVLINEVLQEVLSEEETEFDGDTRWALTWFEQNGLNPGLFGDADTLSKAKNTSVKGVVDSGIAVKREGKVRLKGRDELIAGWDPSDDPRPTVWEGTQHLIAALGNSESEAADLLRRLGSARAERARQLSYLLYQVADRKGWAEEAVAYNGLVQAWPEISRLAGQSRTPIQPTLGE